MRPRYTKPGDRYITRFRGKFAIWKVGENDTDSIEETFPTYEIALQEIVKFRKENKHEKQGINMV